MSHDPQLEIEQRGAVRWLWLNRPAVRNAFNHTLIQEITQAFAAIEADARTRVVVVAARGEVFSAGADLNYMRAMATYSPAQNHADALQVARLFQAVHACSRPVVARLQGDAYGGGVGLAAACDIALAADTAQFALSEVRLGVVAATISPHVVRAMGLRQATRFLLTGEKFSASMAQLTGLVQEVVPANALDAALERVIQNLLKGSPAAQAATKKLLADVIEPTLDDVRLAATAKCIAEARASPEGREGIAAFLEKRAPGWLDPG